MSIRVLVVDDSAVVRQMLVREISRDPGLEVVGTAVDPYVARNKILRLKPDVLTLDIELPRMDGLTFLRKLMRYHPMPVVVVSSLTPRGGELALDAVQAGAVDVVSKPGNGYDLDEMRSDLVFKIKSAARADLSRNRPLEAPPGGSCRPAAGAGPGGAIVAVGASTGGTQALQTILCRMPPDGPPVLVVQHMPEHFTRSFAERLDRIAEPLVREARDGDAPAAGTVLLAPGDRHMVLAGKAPDFRVSVRKGPKVGRHRPSVDVLFKSVARVAGARAVGVLLSGMGADGADGLLEMRRSGAATLVQDEATSVVFGMPREALVRGAADAAVPLPLIAQRVLALAAHCAPAPGPAGEGLETEPRAGDAPAAGRKA